MNIDNILNVLPLKLIYFKRKMKLNVFGVTLVLGVKRCSSCCRQSQLVSLYNTMEEKPAEVRLNAFLIA